jgi:DNA-binding beta-propeller fold protein YncE
MRRAGVAVTLIVVGLSLLTGTAEAAPDDPWVAYVVNSVVTKDGQQSPVLLRVNPATGALEEVSRNSSSQGSLFRHPYDLAVAPGGGSVYVVDMGEFAEGATPAADGRIIRVDPASGAQSIVSAGGELVDPAGIAVAPDGTLFVVENIGVGGNPRVPGGGRPAVLRIDPATGAQSVVTRGGNLCYPFGIALEPSGDLVVTDFGDLLPQIDCPQNFGAVYRVNPGTGAQSVLSVNQVPSPGNLLRGVFGAAVEPGGGILVVNQTGAQAAVASINPVNGEQTALTPNSSAADAFELPQRVAILPDGNLLVADYALNDLEGGLVHVERSTGAARILRQGTLFNNPLGVAVVVNRPPAANLVASPQKIPAGGWVTLDAAGSSDPEGLPLRYAWDVNGDGSFESWTGAVARARIQFKSSTTLTPRVRVTDPHGGVVVAASPSPLVVDGIRPVVSGFRVSARRLAIPAGRAGAALARALRFRFRLSERARVRIAVQRGLPGRRMGPRCVAPGRGRPRAKRCTRWGTVTSLRRHAAPGPNSIRFAGKVRGRAPKPGRYRGVALATDSVGNRSRLSSAGFRVVRVSRQK